MFTNKFYSKVYFSTIEKARKRSWGKERGRERHHIIPESLGGKNDKSNLVYLSCREHFICHWLLVKMTEGENHYKMKYALMNMRAENKYQSRYHTKFTARVYERCRIEHAAYHSKLMKSKKLVPWNKGGAILTDDQRKTISNAAKNRASKTQETIQKWKKARAGYKHSEETKQKQRQSQLGRIKGPQSEVHRKAISDSMKGKSKKEGHANNVRNAVLGNVSINKDNVEKKIKKEELQQWLAEGWQLGGRKRKLR